MQAGGVFIENIGDTGERGDREGGISVGGIGCGSAAKERVENFSEV